MKINLIQSSPKIGDFDYNFTLIKKYYEQSLKSKHDFCIFSECFTTGYPARDLLLNKSFIEALNNHIDLLLPNISNTTLLLPTPLYKNNKLYNGVIAIKNGEIIGSTTKNILAGYKNLDFRYFANGEPSIIQINNKKIGIPIGEDLEQSEICFYLKNLGAELLLAPNASIYEKDIFTTRLNTVSNRYNETQLPIIYCNQVQVQDGLIFDGRSLAYDGDLKTLLPIFKESISSIEINTTQINNKIIDISTVDYLDEVYSAMVYGLRNYYSNNNFKSIILGLSGGIDSALVASISADSVGPANVTAVMMPSKFTSKNSLEDASSIAKSLGLNYQIISIDEMLLSAEKSIGKMSQVAHENLQARIRANILMTLSNSNNSLLLSTGNKSEIAVGYATLYGDMCGGFNPIGDLYKTQVFAISKFRNDNLIKSIDSRSSALLVMPDSVINKAPSAELRENHKDSDTLPEYSILDQILELYIENEEGKKQIIARGYDKITVEKILHLVKNAEFKRQQAAKSIKLTKKSFSHDWYHPITNGFKEL